MASYPYVLLSNKFNTSDFTSSISGLTLEEADARYLKLGSAGSILGVTEGVGAASKALILNSSRNIININSLTTSSLTATTIFGTLSTASQSNITSLGTLTSLSVSGTSLLGNLVDGNPRLRLISSGTIMYFQTGLTTVSGSNADLFFGNIGEGHTISAKKIMMKADGTVGIGTILPSKQLEINSTTGDCLRLTYNDNDGGATVYTDFLVSNLGNLSINPSGTTINISKNVNINYDSYLTMTVTKGDTYGLLKADTTTGAFSVYGTAGTFLYSQAAVSGTQTLLTLGHTAVGNFWYFRHYRDATIANNTLELLNDNSSIYGISLSTFSASSTSTGALMVLNGVGGTGAFIGANQATALGSLHVNASIVKTIPAGWNYTAAGDTSFAGAGGISISAYFYQSLHVRGTVFVTSDRRMKTNIQEYKNNNVLNLLKIKPVIYNWKAQEDNVPQLGYIAQELILNGCEDIVTCFENPEVKDKCEETGAEAGTQFVVDWQKLTVHLVEICKNLNKRIEELEAKI